MTGALTLLSGVAGAAAFTFLRTLLLAAMLPPDEFGRASTMLVGVALVELLSFAGFEARTIHHPDGDAPRVQAALHGAALVRGAAAAVILALAAVPLAALMGLPELAWGFAALAPAALALGATHLDMHRMRRDARFGRLAAAMGGGAAAGLLATAPLALWLGDWRALVGAQLIQCAATVLLSHLVAVRRYRPSIDMAEWRRTLRFCLPLVASGAVVALVLHGDRVAVARFLAADTLGAFGIALALTAAPAQILIRVVAGTCQPRLLRAAQGRRGAEAARTLTLFAAAAVGLAAGGAILGPVAVTTLFGPGLAPAAALVGPLAAVAALRMLRAGWVVIALAGGDSRGELLSAAPRLGAMALGAAALAAGHGLPVLLWVAALGEAVGCALLAARLRGALPPRSAAPALAALPAIAAALAPGAVGAALPAALALPAIVAFLHRLGALDGARRAPSLPRTAPRAS